MDEPLLRRIDAVTVRVPDLDAGLRFYRDHLGHALQWRNDELGQAALALPDSDTELVLTTQHPYEPNWLVASVEEAAGAIVAGGGRILAPPFEIPNGRVSVVADPFDNVLVLVDLQGQVHDNSRRRRDRRRLTRSARLSRAQECPGSQRTHAERRVAESRVQGRKVTGAGRRTRGLRTRP
jgi:catechol 2,3-dioxygenase-like lactoylglutathione lyase family enzyme